MTKILLVEDDPLIYRMYTKAFEHEGFKTEVAVNGKEGLEKVKSFEPDIILLDVMMPEMNGVEMLAKLKEDEATRNIPTVVLSNMSGPLVGSELFNYGVNLTLVKSETEPDQVVAWINSVLDKSKQKDPEEKSGE